MATSTTVSATQTAIQAYAQAAGVDPGIALAVAQLESNFSMQAVSSAGAIGVFQLMPGTAAQLGVNPSDLTSNIQGGINYLSQLYSEFGNWPDALAAYNWGPGNVQNYGSGNYPASVQNYVSSVLSLAASYGSLAADASEMLPASISGPLTSILPSTTTGYIAWAIGGVVVLSLLFD